MSKTGTMNVATWVIFLHVAVIGSFLVFQGCGTFFEPAKTYDDVEVVLPAPGPVHPGLAVQRPVAPPLGAFPQAGDTSSQWPGSVRKYTIKSGDTLGAVAAANGITVKQILALNPSIKDPNRIHLNQVIELPVRATAGRVGEGRVDREVAAAPTPARTVQTGEKRYKVKRGDSLSVIAYNHGVSTKALMARNSLGSDRINIDDELIIPAKGDTPSPARPTLQRPDGQPPVRDERRAPPVDPDAEIPPIDLPPIDLDIESDVRPAVDPARPAEFQSNAVEPPVSDVAQGSHTPVLPRVTSRFANHVVEPNEDIYKIGMVWDVNVSRIREANNLPRDAELKVGQELRIPLID